MYMNYNMLLNYLKLMEKLSYDKRREDQLRLPLLHPCGINRNKNMKINFWKKIGNMNDLEFYRKYQENASFLKAIFEMFLNSN